MNSQVADYIKKDTKNVMGLFKATRDLNGLVTELQQIGCSPDDISVIMSNQTKDTYFNHNEAPEVVTKLENKAPEGFTAGAFAGGTIGAIIGGLTLTGSLLVPGSQVLLLGPALGVIAGGAAGSAAGSLIGALIGFGIPEVEAKFYKDAVDQEENVMIVVRALKGSEDRINDTLKKYDPEKTYITG